MGLYVDIKKDFGDFKLEAWLETEGGITGVLGESGCGKTMTLRCIAGFVKPDEGRIELDGEVLFDSEKGIWTKPQQRRVGLLFQNYALFPNMTVEQNLLTGLRSRERNRGRARREVKEMAERFRLKGLEDHMPSQLSGGQQQRAALARILLSRPRLLMLDEPFSALDEFLRWNLEEELMEALKDFDAPTLFVSHNREEIYRICSRVSVMDKGKIQETVSVREFFRHPKTRAAAYLIGCKNFSEAVRTGDGELFASRWGISLKCEEALSKEISWIGIRSRGLRPAGEQKAEQDLWKGTAETEAADGKRPEKQTSEKQLPCRILWIRKEMDSVTVSLEPIFGKPGTRLWMERPGQEWEELWNKKHPGEKLEIAIPKEEILFLSD